MKRCEACLTMRQFRKAPAPKTSEPKYTHNETDKQKQKTKIDNRYLNISEAKVIEQHGNGIKLRIVSWNINMRGHSSYASVDWKKSADKWQLIFNQTICEDPDIITFQEMPNADLAQLFLQTNEWQVSKGYPSHMGYSYILLHVSRITSQFQVIQWNVDPSKKYAAIILRKKQLLENSNVNDSDDNYNAGKRDQEQKLQSKCNNNNNTDNTNNTNNGNKRYPDEHCESKMNDNLKKNKHVDGNNSNINSNSDNTTQEEQNASLILFGVHLPPFGGYKYAKQRRMIFDRLYNKVSRDKYGLESYFMLIGDTNMRAKEEVDILNNNFYKREGITSCWNSIDYKSKKQMFTWNSFYFDQKTDVKARYDKAFCGKNVKCLNMRIFDQNVSDEPRHFLSDHRGIVVDIELV